MPETVTTKKNKNITKNAEMSFWDHLDALRGHLFRSALSVVAFATLAFVNREIIFDKIILAPKEPGFITNVLFCKVGKFLNIDGLCIENLKINIINLNLSGQFTTHLSISFFAGLILAMPYILWEIWRFLKPALYENERRNSRGAVIVTSLLFLLGITFSYFVLVPITLSFFGSYSVSTLIENQISLSSYISTLVSVTFSVGVVFEMPVFIYFLSKIGIVTPEFLKKSRKYMIVLIVTVAAIITPPDVFSQIVVSIPLLLLYEASIIVSSRVSKRRAALN